MKTIHRGLIIVIAVINTGKLIEVEVLLLKFKNRLKLLNINRVIVKNIISKSILLILYILVKNIINKIKNINSKTKNIFFFFFI